MDNKVKNILKYLFWTAVAVVLVWFCVRAIDWKEFTKALKLCNWWYVAAAFVTGAVFIIIHGLRWHMLIKPLAPSITKKDVINAYGIGFIANIALPKVGEAVKIGYIVSDAGTTPEGRRRLGWDAAIGTYLAEKAVDAVVLIIVTIIFFLGAWGKADGSVELGGGSMAWAAAGLLVLVAAVAIVSYRLRARGGIFLKIWNFIAGIGDGLRSIGKLENPALFFFYTALIWVGSWLTSTFIVWAINDIEPFTVLDAAAGFNLMVAGSISTLIPVPGGFGAFHGAVATVMQAVYGIPVGSGMIYATLNHETQILAQAVTGFWCYLSQTFFRK